MTRRRHLFFAASMLSIVIPAASSGRAVSAHNDTRAVPASCPVTLPSDPAFIPPDPYPTVPPGPGFWHGTPGLWARLDSTGVWTGIPSHSTLAPNEISTRNKFFWWTPDYRPIGPPDPRLKVEARRLDAPAPALPQPWVTNAHVPEWGGWTMLIMLDLPTLGCWEVKGTYGADTISFVVWVAPPPRV
jgi:hypothetical protein